MKLRKVLALTLAAAMTLSLAACGGSDEGAAEAPAADDTAAEAPAADDAADDGAAAEELLQRLRQVSPMHPSIWVRTTRI